MGFVPAANVVQLEAIYGSYTEKCENVFHVKGGAAWDLTTMAALGTAFKSWETTYGSHMRANTAQLIEMRLTDLTTQNGFVLDSAVTPAIVGANGVGAQANNVTWAIKGITGLRGRSFRGRFYYIGLAANIVSANIILAAGATNVISDYSQLFAALAAVNTSTIGVLSRRHNGADRVAGVFTPYTNWTYTDLIVDSQRRRLPGHNVHR